MMMSQLKKVCAVSYSLVLYNKPAITVCCKTHQEKCENERDLRWPRCQATRVP